MALTGGRAEADRVARRPRPDTPGTGLVKPVLSLSRGGPPTRSCGSRMGATRGWPLVRGAGQSPAALIPDPSPLTPASDPSPLRVAHVAAEE